MYSFGQAMEADDAALVADVASITLEQVNDGGTTYSKLQRFVKRINEFCVRRRIRVRKQAANAKKALLVQFCVEVLPTGMNDVDVLFLAAIDSCCE